MKSGEKGLSRIISATRYSWLGLRAAWRHEAAFRQEAMLAIIGFPLAAYLARDAVDFLLLVVPLLLLMLPGATMDYQLLLQEKVFSNYGSTATRL